MASMATQARLNQIEKRACQTVYKGLAPPEKRFIKLREQLADAEKGLRIFWQGVSRDAAGRADDSNDWDTYHFLAALQNSTRKKLERLTQKHGWADSDMTAILREHQMTNMLHCYGGSF